MIDIRNVHRVLPTALLGLLFLGCSGTDACSPANEVLLNEFVIIERDAGVIAEELLVYDFLIGGSEIKEIARIVADCGCTRVFLHRGDIFDFSQPFRVLVQLQGLRFGRGHQDFLIQFSDDTAIVCRLVYVYAPPPFAKPNELRFFADVNRKEIILCFPNEPGVVVQEVIHPVGITWKREPAQEKRYEVRLVFEVDRSLFGGNPMGRVEVLTTSQEKPLFSLPYLVLRP